jgi:hypothetical protein
MSNMAYVISVTAGSYSDRQSVVVVVCYDRRSAEEACTQIEGEIARINWIAVKDDTAIHIRNCDGIVGYVRWGPPQEPLRGYLQVPAMTDFYWFLSEPPKVQITEAPTYGAP